MPLLSTEKATLDTAMLAVSQNVAALAGHIAALVADEEPHPLQVALDAALAERDSLAQSLQVATADLLATVDQRNALLAKIDASKAHLQASVTADAAEDSARNAALQALE